MSDVKAAGESFRMVTWFMTVDRFLFMTNAFMIISVRLFWRTDGGIMFTVMKKWIKNKKYRMIRSDEHENKRGIYSVLAEKLQNNR